LLEEGGQELVFCG